MRWTHRIGFSVAILAMGATGSSCSWSADFAQPHPLPVIPQGSDFYYPGKPALKAMYRCDRLSWEDYQKDIRAYAEASRQLEVEARTNPWHSHLRPFHKVGQSHQTINRTVQNNREYVVQWFCYIKGNGAAVWDHRP